MIRLSRVVAVQYADKGISEVLCLASDEARFITGTEIVVDGGMTVRRD